MPAGLKGRTVIVTGASRGIGFGAARVFVEAGANVVLTSRQQESADAAAAKLNATTPEDAGTAVGFAAHAVDSDAAEACVQHTLERFGSIDVLVNNAGTNPAYGPLIDQDHQRFAKTFDVNVWAPLHWTALVVRAWMGVHGGAIVNTASIGGISVEPDLGIYNATKAALIHLTRQQAAELAPKVRVNAVAPGVVRTKLAELLWSEHEQQLNEQLPLGRIGEPADIGSAIAFLASDDAAWITGQTLIIDGGATLMHASAAQDASATNEVVDR